MNSSDSRTYLTVLRTGVPRDSRPVAWLIPTVLVWHILSWCPADTSAAPPRLRHKSPRHQYIFRKFNKKELFSIWRSFREYPLYYCDQPQLDYYSGRYYWGADTAWAYYWHLLKLFKSIDLVWYYDMYAVTHEVNGPEHGTREEYKLHADSRVRKRLFKNRRLHRHRSKIKTRRQRNKHNTHPHNTHPHKKRTHKKRTHKEEYAEKALSLMCFY